MQTNEVTEVPEIVTAFPDLYHDKTRKNLLGLDLKKDSITLGTTDCWLETLNLAFVTSYGHLIPPLTKPSNRDNTTSRCQDGSRKGANASDTILEG